MVLVFVLVMLILMLVLCDVGAGACVVSAAAALMQSLHHTQGQCHGCVPTNEYCIYSHYTQLHCIHPLCPFQRSWS